MTDATESSNILARARARGGDLWTGEVAALAGVTNMTIVRWANAGKIECSRTIGRDRRFTRPEVARLLADLGRAVPSWLAAG